MDLTEFPLYGIFFLLMTNSSGNLPISLKDLPRKQALLCLKVCKALCKTATCLDNSHFLLAVSGGADSTALAIICKLLSKIHGFKLSLAHINHKLRPEADNEQVFVEQLAQRLNITWRSFHLDVQKLALELSCGLEEAGRKGRMQILDNFRLESGADFILTGHHARDLAEDILMRLARGAGWPALGGMKMRNGFYFRPLLHIDPAELRMFLLTINQVWQEDASNYSPEFKRNRFRNEILPLFSRENREFIRNMGELHELAEIDAEFWHERLTEKLNKHPWHEEKLPHATTIFVPAQTYASQPAAEQLRLFMLAFNRLKELSGQPCHARARTLLKMLKSIDCHTKNTFQFPGKVSINTGKDGLRLSISHP